MPLLVISLVFRMTPYSNRVPVLLIKSALMKLRFGIRKSFLQSAGLLGHDCYNDVNWYKSHSVTIIIQVQSAIRR